MCFSTLNGLPLSSVSYTTQSPFSSWKQPVISESSEYLSLSRGFPTLYCWHYSNDDADGYVYTKTLNPKVGDVVYDDKGFELLNENGYANPQIANSTNTILNSTQINYFWILHDNRFITDVSPNTLTLTCKYSSASNWVPIIFTRAPEYDKNFNCKERTLTITVPNSSSRGDVQIFNIQGKLLETFIIDAGDTYEFKINDEAIIIQTERGGGPVEYDTNDATITEQFYDLNERYRFIGIDNTGSYTRGYIYNFTSDNPEISVYID